MASNNPTFTPDEFLKTQLDILKSFEKKLHSLFVESVASNKKPTRKIVLELLGILRETTSWYIRINESMLVQNTKKSLTKRKTNLN